MNSERQRAYLNLINQLLTCPSGEEAEVLNSHPDLLDDGLVAAMLEEADNLRKFGVLDNANRLMNCAGILIGMNSNSSVAITGKAEADRLLKQGNQQYRISQFREALQSWEQALTIYRDIGYRQGEADSLGSLGLAYNSLGQYHKAIDFYEQSLVIKREIGDREGEANSLGNLGLAYRALGQYHKAIDFYEQQLVIVRDIGYREGEANSLCGLGNAYDSLGQYDRAIEFHQQSLVISRDIRYRQGEADSLGSLGLAYDSLGQYHKAIDFHQQSLVIEREIENRSGEAASLCNLGLAYKSLGQYHKAIHFYEQSLVISREIGQDQWQANSLSNLGITYYQISNGLRIPYTTAPKFLAFFIKKPLRFFEIYFLQEAEAKLRKSIQIRETLRSELVKDDYKISIFETQLNPYRNLQKVLVAQNKFEEALEISEMGRTRAFAELLQQNLLTTDLATNEVTNTLSIAKIQQIAQQKNSTIVEYSIIFDEDIYIWVIQPNGNITHRAANLEPLNQQNQSLKQIILKTRVSIGVDETDDEGNKIQMESKYQPDMEGGYPLLKLLHQILIEPIADLLPTDPDSPIIFIPHYDLFLVPFTALQSANNRYLIEDHTILTAPSIQVLEQTSAHQQTIKKFKQTALVVGDPTIHPSLSQKNSTLRQLPKIKEAAEAIAAILQTQAITGENATKAVVIDQMLKTRIVHLSTHGVFDHSQKSGIPGTIILAPSIEPEDDDDGALNAIDILQLKLNSELVVLSACSTGRGTITGDGVNGLSRCFILAGVPSIIVSLWNMGAPSAKLLMTEFYQNLAQGDNRAAALRYAMLTAKDRFTRPKTWAAFTLIGEIESISLETEKIDLRRFVMSLLNNTSKEIVIALTKLFKTAPMSIFAKDLPALSRSVKSTDDVNILAEKIKDWCEGIPSVKLNLEDEIGECGIGGTDDDAPEEIEREFMETLEENMMRLYPSGPPVSVVETEDSGTES